MKAPKIFTSNVSHFPFYLNHLLLLFLPLFLQNFPQDNQKVRLSISGFLCAFEIPIPGSPISASSPIQTGMVELELVFIISTLNTGLRTIILFILIWAKDIKAKEFWRLKETFVMI